MKKLLLTLALVSLTGTAFAQAEPETNQNANSEGVTDMTDNAFQFTDFDSDQDGMLNEDEYNEMMGRMQGTSPELFNNKNPETDITEGNTMSSDMAAPETDLPPETNQEGNTEGVEQVTQ